MIKAIFWDFDGVIAESVNVKTEAFYNLYLPYGIEIAEKVRRHHLDNGGMSRFENSAITKPDFWVSRNRWTKRQSRNWPHISLNWYWRA